MAILAVPLVLLSTREDALSMPVEVSAEVASTIPIYGVDRKVNSSRAVDPRDETLVQPVNT